MKYLLSILLAALMPAVCAAQGGHVTLTLDEENHTIQMGEPFYLELHRSWPAGFIRSEFNARSIAPIQVLKVVSRTATSESSEQLRLQCVLFRTGTTTINRIRFSAMPTAQGREFVAFTDPLEIVVPSVLPLDDVGLLEGMGPPMDVPWGAMIWGRMALLGVFFVGVFCGVRAFATKTSGGEFHALAPAEIALRQLQGETASDPCDHYAAIGRRYLLNVLGRKSVTATVGEMADMLNGLSLENDRPITDAIDLLHITDKGRFSNRRPTDEILQAAVARWSDALRQSISSEVPL